MKFRQCIGLGRVVLGASLLILVSCGPRGDEASSIETPEPTAGSLVTIDVPAIDATGMEPQVAERFREVARAVEADPSSAQAWGSFGKVAHVHELLDEAAAAYRQAEVLDPEEGRWPYFLGDVLFIQSDLDGARASFERAKTLLQDYAPLAMRLGEVLRAEGQDEEAAAELERALRLDDHLQPARLSLAQIRMGQGNFEEAERLLRLILEANPRHTQALATLARVTQRLGDREEAREIGERSKSAAFYNLYHDPLMGEVVREGVSGVLIWERARAFLETGNDEQAVIGLRKVVELQPDNEDAHHQLALAYRNLGQVNAARRHLERVVELDPDRSDARIQLAGILLEAGEGAAALPHLEKVLATDARDPDVSWYLGRAYVQVGAPLRAVEAFERAESIAAADSLTTPAWAHNEWGNALAQTGRLDEALAKFQTALGLDPVNPQTLFYLGLVYEGQGRMDLAVEHYCRSMRIQPNPPAASRLQALGRSCPG